METNGVLLQTQCLPLLAAFWLRMLAKGCLYPYEDLWAPQSGSLGKPQRVPVLKLLMHWIHLGSLPAA